MPVSGPGGSCPVPSAVLLSQSGAGPQGVLTVPCLGLGATRGELEGSRVTGPAGPTKGHHTEETVPGQTPAFMGSPRPQPRPPGARPVST